MIKHALSDTSPTRSSPPGFALRLGLLLTVVVFVVGVGLELVAPNPYWPLALPGSAALASGIVASVLPWALAGALCVTAWLVVRLWMPQYRWATGFFQIANVLLVLFGAGALTDIISTLSAKHQLAQQNAASSPTPRVRGSYNSGTHAGRLFWADIHCPGGIAQSALRDFEVAKALDPDQFAEGLASGAGDASRTADQGSVREACDAIEKLYGVNGANSPNVWIKKY